MEEKKETNYAVLFGGAVYVGAVVVAVILFISYVLSAFASNQYATRAIMTIGGILVGASSIALPIYIHTRATESAHRIAAIVLYAGEICFMALNVVVSFTVLQAQQGTLLVPEWMIYYEPYSVMSIVYVVATWAVLFSLDPSYKETLRRKKLERRRADLLIEQDELVFKQEAEFLKSIEGENFIMELAKKNIAAKKLSANSDAPRHFGSAQIGTYAAETKKQELEDRPNASSQR